MSIKYFINDKDGFLKIIASGLCEDLDQCKEYVFPIQNALISTGHKKLLIDETLLEYKLSTIDIYNLGCFVSQLPQRPHKIALLCNVNDWHDAKFWGTVLVNRLVLAQVFRDHEDAERWVLQ